MGRHSSGENNYRVSGSFLFAVLALILVVGLFVAWLVARDSSDRGMLGFGKECTEGDMTLVVAADPAMAAPVQQLVDQYADSNPIVQDYCVRPQLMKMGSHQVVELIHSHANLAANPDGGIPVADIPGVWVPADVNFLEGIAGDNMPQPAQVESWIEPQPVGVAVAADRAEELGGLDWLQLAGFNIVAPGDTDAFVSTVATQAMAGDYPLLPELEHRNALTAAQSAQALIAQLPTSSPAVEGVPATSSMVANDENVTLVTPDNTPVLQGPVVAFSSGDLVLELKARAAADFAEFAKESQLTTETGEAATFVNSPEFVEGDIWLSHQRVTAAEAGDPAAGGFADPNAPSGLDGEATAAGVLPGQSLVVLDSSTVMPLDVARDGLRPALEEAIHSGLGDNPRRVALWSYSDAPALDASPVRPAVYFDPALGDGLAATQEALNNVQPGGDPWLWRALRDSYAYATEHFADGTPNRMVVVTSGADVTPDDPNLQVDALLAAFNPERPVHIDIVVVGGNETTDLNDQPLRRLAEATGGSYVRLDPADTVAVNDSLAAALGVARTR